MGVKTSRQDRVELNLAPRTDFTLGLHLATPTPASLHAWMYYICRGLVFRHMARSKVNLLSESLHRE